MSDLSRAKRWTAHKKVINMLLAAEKSVIIFGGALETIVRHDAAGKNI